VNHALQRMSRSLTPLAYPDTLVGCNSCIASFQPVVKPRFGLQVLCLRSDAACTDLIEALLDSMQQYCVPKARLHICICGDDTEQCGHVGVNHATALGNASHSDLLAQNLCLRTAVTLLASLPQILKHAEC
jgi:hypothetical protein